MKIEALVPPARPGKPWTLHLEGGETLKVGEGVAADFALCTGKILEEETLKELRTAVRFAALRDYAITLLTGRILSTGMLAEKLAARGAEPVQTEEIVAWAEDVGLLNDREYAMALARHGQSRGWGVYKIKAEFRRRRVPREHWEEALAALDGPEEAIDAFLARKLTDPEDRKQVKKAADALMRRGFTWEQVSEGIERSRRAWRDGH